MTDAMATNDSNQPSLWCSQTGDSQDIGKLAEELIKRERLVDWATSVLAEGVKRVLAHRPLTEWDKTANRSTKSWMTMMSNNNKQSSKTVVRIPLDDIVDVIDFKGNSSNADSSATWNRENIEQRMSMIQLPEDIQHLLRELVSVVSVCVC